MDNLNNEVVFKNELEDIFKRFGSKNQEGVKEALRFCQNTFNYVSISHQNQIADIFSLDSKIITTLIKFSPSIKESKTEYEIVCCSGPRCAKNGSVEVLKAIKKSLGIDFDEVTPDGKIRLTTQNCFKKCGLGPNIMVNGKFYHHMTKEKAENLINEILKK